MTDAQTLLVIVVVALTILLTVVGIQVILVIFELKRTLRRINSLLEDSILGGGLLRPDKLTGILELFGKRKKMETHGEDAFREKGL